MSPCKRLVPRFDEGGERERIEIPCEAGMGPSVHRIVLCHPGGIEYSVTHVQARDERRICQYLAVGEDRGVNVSDDVACELLEAREMAVQNSQRARAIEAHLIEELLGVPQRRHVVKLEEIGFLPGTPPLLLPLKKSA